MTTLQRKTRVDPQSLLFDRGTSWESEWWGMPHFSMGDARPSHKITVNFATLEDVAEFAKATGLKVSTRSDSCWFPHQEPLRGEYFYDGPKTDSKYPVCIPSKGRADCQKTGKALERMGVSHWFFVEETEYEEYVRHLGSGRVVKMPFHDLGQGSIPARNFIWEWAKQRGHKRHWTVDDNITAFVRMDNNRRLCVYGGGFFMAMEDFVDRYDNIAMAGPHHLGFVKDRGDVLKPLKGGNTDNVYNTGDHRLAFAQSLADQHPDCVEVVWKFNRWHHQVDYSRFKGNRLKRREGIVESLASNDYGMYLKRAEATA